MTFNTGNIVLSLCSQWEKRTSCYQSGVKLNPDKPIGWNQIVVYDVEGQR